MAQTLDLSSARLQTGAVHGSVLRQALGKLDFSRICAESGAIAVHVAALMLLLAPMSMPPAPPPEEVFQDYHRIVPPKPPERVPVEVPVRQPVQPVRTPIVQPVVPPTPIVVPEATEIDLPPITEGLADAKSEPTDTIAITEPLAGAHLEYEFAPPPRYSAEMMRAGLEGTVLLRVLVDLDGKPLEVTIERSSGHRELDQAARRQVLTKWRFKPAVQDGQVVQAIGMVPVDFQLN